MTSSGGAAQLPSSLSSLHSADGFPRSLSQPERDARTAWKRFEVEQERCRSRFARLSELPEWNAGPWHELYNEALQARAPPTSKVPIYFVCVCVCAFVRPAAREVHAADERERASLPTARPHSEYALTNPHAPRRRATYASETTRALICVRAPQEHGKLWQLKDRHREVLKRAGMTRWQVGEIASRIGQIYYEYYNRTGEARFLREACVWYDTIRKRQYFRPAEPTTGELLQQLRYYMRFTLVCILLDELSKARLPGCHKAPRTPGLLLCTAAFHLYALRPTRPHHHQLQPVFVA